MAKRPKLPRSLRLATYRRDGFACLHCGWSVPEPDGYRGINAIHVVVGHRTERRLVKPSWTDEPDVFEDVVLKIVRSLEIDHIHPLDKGGAFRDPANLQTLCSVCNNRKGTKV